MKIKMPNVAGSFYPADRADLSAVLDQCFAHSKQAEQITDKLRAIVAPHAGYIYSGSVAASAYNNLEKIKDQIKTVVILSPSHFFGFAGIALSDVSHFRTPLGDIEVDHGLQQVILDFPQIQVRPEAFEREHALEIHLPLLQTVLENFKIIPMIVGQTSPEEVQSVIQALDQEGVFFVVSSDLSHFHNYETCQNLDSKTTKAIEEKSIDNIGGNDACGYYPLRGLLSWANDKNLNIKNIDLRNSGDTAGDKSRVVGYGSYLVY